LGFGFFFFLVWLWFLVAPRHHPNPPNPPPPPKPPPPPPPRPPPPHPTGPPPPPQPPAAWTEDAAKKGETKDASRKRSSGCRRSRGGISEHHTFPSQENRTGSGRNGGRGGGFRKKTAPLGIRLPENSWGESTTKKTVSENVTRKKTESGKRFSLALHQGRIHGGWGGEEALSTKKIGKEG